MKNLFRLLSLLCIVGFVSSCSTPENPAVLVLGNWSLTDVQYTGASNTYDSTGTWIGNIEYDGVGHDYAYEVTYTGSPKEYVGAGTFGLEMTIDDVALPLPYVAHSTVTNPFGTGTYTIDGHTLVMTSGVTDIPTSVVFSNNNNTMEVYRVTVSTITVNGDVTTVNMDRRYTFTRQ